MRACTKLFAVALGIGGCRGQAQLFERPHDRCPSASAIHLVHWSGGPDLAGGDEQWRLVLAVTPVELDQPLPPQPYPTERLPNVPRDVVMHPRGAAACHARTAVDAYRAVGGAGQTYEELGIVVEDCPSYEPIGDDPHGRLAWAIDGAELPDGCELLHAVEEPEDRNPELALFAPAPFSRTPEARPASFERRTRVVVARSRGRAVASQLVTSFVEQPVRDPCAPNADDHQDLFVAGPAGLVRVPAEPDVVHGDLLAVMVEDGTVRALVTHALGTYLVIPIDRDGRAQPPIQRTYRLPAPEEAYRFSLAPSCSR